MNNILHIYLKDGTEDLSNFISKIYLLSVTQVDISLKNDSIMSFPWLERLENLNELCVTCRVDHTTLEDWKNLTNLKKLQLSCRY